MLEFKPTDNVRLQARSMADESARMISRLINLAKLRTQEHTNAGRFGPKGRAFSKESQPEYIAAQTMTKMRDMLIKGELEYQRLKAIERTHRRMKNENASRSTKKKAKERLPLGPDMSAHLLKGVEPRFDANLYAVDETVVCVGTDVADDTFLELLLRDDQERYRKYSIRRDSDEGLALSYWLSRNYCKLRGTIFTVRDNGHGGRYVEPTDHY